jgi:hypothetical protein
MVYTANSLIRSDAITKENIALASGCTWRGTVIHLKNANVLNFGISMQSQIFPLFHLRPSDPGFPLAPPPVIRGLLWQTELNRKMEPLTVMVGSFTFLMEHTHVVAY